MFDLLCITATASCRCVPSSSQVAQARVVPRMSPLAAAIPCRIPVVLHAVVRKVPHQRCPRPPDSSGARLACGVRNGAVRQTTTSEGATMRVGFIGQGAMGSRMAARLLSAGHDLVVFDRLREATRPLEQRGATVA